MNTIKMSQFGQILTGRDFGRKVIKELEGGLVHPVVLDFADTISLGSSFGEEIVPAIAKRQGDKVRVLNANKAIWACLQKIALDFRIEVSQPTSA